MVGELHFAHIQQKTEPYPTSWKSIEDNYEKFVVSLDDVAFPSNKGIKHVQAWGLGDLL